MFVIRTYFYVDPESEGFNLVAGRCAQIACSHGGCRGYQFEKVVDEEMFSAGLPILYVLYEEWEDRQSYEAYEHSKDFKRVGDMLTPFFAGEPRHYYFEAKEVEL